MILSAALEMTSPCRVRSNSNNLSQRGPKYHHCEIRSRKIWMGDGGWGLGIGVFNASRSAFSVRR